MTENEIRKAIADGETVRWKSMAYKVVNHFDNLYIKAFNNSMAPLAGDYESCYVELKPLIEGESETTSERE